MSRDSDGRPGRRMPGSEGPSLTSKKKPEAKKESGGISPRAHATTTRRPGSGGGGKRGGGSGKGGGSGGRKGGGRKPARTESTGFGARLKAILLSRSMALGLGSLALTGFIALLGAVIFFSRGLPDISLLAEPRKTFGIQVLSAEGDIIKSYGQIYGEDLTFDQMPKTLVQAVLATEDRNYFSHFGVDPWGITRAMVVNARAGHAVQGGSTITQQLAKNVFLTPDRTLKRKVQEMLLAFWLESRFSKEQILSIYLNRVYLGSGNYGVDAAAHHYFGKSATDLTLPESAMIAGLLKAPSRYAPTSNLELSKKRAHQVLLNMVDAGELKQAQADQAFANFHLPDSLESEDGRSSRYYADWIVDQLPELLPNLQDDIIIHTTLEPAIQRDAESAIGTVLTPEVMQKKKVSQAALVAMRPNGAVVAMVGGVDYAKSQFNRATQAKRQPGSSFKMLVYTAGMEAGFRPDQYVDDHPITISTSSGPWTPRNYTGKYLGPVPLREAVAQSLNTVAVQVAQSVGLGNIINTARRLGITSELPKAWSISLGAAEVSLFEMTTAYAHLASNGQGVRPYGITEIRRKADNSLLFERRDTGAYIVLRKDVVAMMNTVLSGVITSGTGRAAAIGRPAAGKTGTTSDYKDAWFMGYTPDLVAGVWIGNDDNTPTAKITGGNLPAQIWSGFMKQAEEGVAVASLPMDYGGAPPLLPWQQPGDATIAGNTAVVGAQSARQQPSQSNRDVNLGNSFWDKLFDGGSRGKVEYEYPSQRR